MKIFLVAICLKGKKMKKIWSKNKKRMIERNTFLKILIYWSKRDEI